MIQQTALFWALKWCFQATKIQYQFISFWWHGTLCRLHFRAPKTGQKLAINHERTRRQHVDSSTAAEEEFHIM
jgi:hypothetical protein